MSISQRLMNLIVTCRSIAAPALSCVDLRSQLFGHAMPPDSTTGDGSSESAEQYYYPRRILEPAASLQMESLRLPSPIFSYGALSFPREHVVDCFPLTDGKVVFSERSGHTTLFDAHARSVVHLPKLHKPKETPISLFVPSADAGGDHQGGGSGTLYVMEGTPNRQVCNCSALSGQFEAFVCDSSQTTASSPQWHCRLLPPPPFVRSWYYNTRIISYAVVGSDIWISTDSAETHRLDTTRHFFEKSTATDLWGFVGSWMLPFHGKVEYVPELKLWFGFSSQNHEHFAAADLGTTKSQPQLLGDLKEFEPPEDWVPAGDCQFAYMGSGCFCIARFYQILPDDYCPEWERTWITVLTGVEATRIEHDGTCRGTGNGKVKFTKHKSRCLISSGPIITDVF